MAHSVVHFVEGDTRGGCEEVVMMLLAGLDRGRWRPMLFHQGGPRMSEVANELSRVGVVSRTVPVMNSRNAVSTIGQFARALREAQATVFHAHLSWALGCRYAVVAAKLSRVPAIVTTSHLCSTLSEVRARRWKHFLQGSIINRHIAVSDHVKANLCEDLRVRESKVRVVRNGIPLVRFNRPTNTSLRAALSKGSQLPIVFTPARLHPQKGLVYLLEAAALFPDALFAIAGEGPERQSLEEYARKLGVDERVSFLGYRQDIPDLLAASDLFVLPSMHEGLPLSVLEAMAASKPVVATAIGGTEEAVIHNSTGLLVPPGSPTALAAAIRKVLSDRGLAARLGAAGKSRVMLEFSSEAMVRGVSGVYDEIITTSQQHE